MSQVDMTSYTSNVRSHTLVDKDSYNCNIRPHTLVAQLDTVVVLEGVRNGKVWGMKGRHVQVFQGWNLLNHSHVVLKNSMHMV